MEFKGINLKGANFFPVLEKQANPAFHKYGAVATITQNTDTVSSDYPEKEIAGFKYNFNLTAFISPFAANVDVQNIKKTGLIRYGIYFPTDRWDDPKQPGVFPVIPDYNSNVWTQAGVDAGFVTSDKIGTSKAIKHPNHGQQLFDLTNGLYGYDFTTDTPGQIDVFSPLAEYISEWFKDMFGYYPSSASYRNGVRNASFLMTSYFLGGRNSIYDYNINYGLTKGEAIDKSESTRQGDMYVSMSRAEVLQQCSATLEKAITDNGWYSDFTHWHTAPKGEMEEYLSNQRTVINGRDVISLDYGTSIEYQFLRKMVRRSGLYADGNKLVLITDIKDNEGLVLIRINTTLSVEVDLTGTILEGKEITGIGDRGIRKKATNQFVIEVPYSQKDGFMAVRLKETTTPTYLDFTVPVVNSFTKNGNILTVTTDKHTKVVVYRTPLNGELYDASVIGRSEDFNTSHEIDVSGVDFANSDIYVGAISKERQSSLSDKYNF